MNLGTDFIHSQYPFRDIGPGVYPKAWEDKLARDLSRRVACWCLQSNTTMTTIMRHPFTTRHPDPSEKLMAPTKALQTISSNKRPRSPGVDDTIFAAKIKRAKTGSSQPLTTAIPHTINTREIKERKEKLRQKEERQQAKEEFVAKYTKAFPSFVFYFDDRDEGIRQLAESRVLALGAVCFVSSVSLFIFVDSHKEDRAFFLFCRNPCDHQSTTASQE